jgi:hypothetical protein
MKERLTNTPSYEGESEAESALMDPGMVLRHPAAPDEADDEEQRSTVQHSHVGAWRSSSASAIAGVVCK